MAYDESILSRPPEQFPPILLRPSDQPRPESDRKELDTLLFDIAESRVRQIAEQMRRYVKPSCDFNYLKYPRFEELSVFRRYTDGQILHPLFEDGNAVGVVRPAMQ
jgi:hypothetical protein